MRKTGFSVVLLLPLQLEFSYATSTVSANQTHIATLKLLQTKTWLNPSKQNNCWKVFMQAFTQNYKENELLQLRVKLAAFSSHHLSSAIFLRS